MSLHVVPPTCFNLYLAIQKDVSNKGMQKWQIILKLCSLTEYTIIAFKIQCFQLKLLKNI